MIAPLRRPFLLYVPRHWMPVGVADNILGIVYAPQLVCSSCGQFLFHGFLRGNRLLGYECASGFGETKTWVQFMEKARAYSSVEQFWNESLISSKQVGMMRGLACMVQIWPENRFAAGMFKIMQAGKEFTDNQKTAVRRMIEERGGWEALVERRDHIYRCEVMELLYQSGRKIASRDIFDPLGIRMVSNEDRAVFKSLKSSAYRFGLSEKQAGKLWKMEEDYLELKSSLAWLVGRILFRGRES